MCHTKATSLSVRIECFSFANVPGPQKDISYREEYEVIRANTTRKQRNKKEKTRQDSSKSNSGDFAVVLSMLVVVCVNDKKKIKIK